jgi:hypothetical protein
MYRRINPTSRQQLPMRMLFQPLGNGTFLRACEADSFRGLVAAMLDDPAYESGDVETRLRTAITGVAASRATTRPGSTAKEGLTRVADRVD